MELIESKTLTASASSIEFINIPQDGTDLVIFLSGRRDSSSGSGQALLRFNADTGANYSARTLAGNGSTASSSSLTYTLAGEVGNSTDTANTFNNTSLYVPNYTGATAKSFATDTVTENNATTAFQSLAASIWTGTAAITSLQIVLVGSGNFVVGSIVSLYKVTKGTDGIVTTS